MSLDKYVHVINYETDLLSTQNKYRIKIDG